LIEVKPRAGSHIIEEDDIIAVLEAEGSSIACILIGGVQYYTGQFFDIARIAKVANSKVKMKTCLSASYLLTPLPPKRAACLVWI